MVSQPPDEQDLNSDQLDEHFEDMEEMDEVHHKLKIPKDLEGHGGDRFDMANDEEDDDEEEKVQNEDSEDPENDIFAQARENQELKYANEEMLDKIKKIEDEMMDQKKWQMKGEIQCNDRAYNSLLEEYVDFDTASKLPPQITQETTN